MHTSYLLQIKSAADVKRNERFGKKLSIVTRRETVSKPAVVNVYNHSMNGVDIADQLTVFYSFVRKTKKLWRNFFFFLEVSVVNSYLLY